MEAKAQEKACEDRGELRGGCMEATETQAGTWKLVHLP